MRGCAYHREGAHRVGDIRDPLRIGLLGLAERTAHGDDDALVLLHPGFPRCDSPGLPRLAFGLRQGVPRRPLRTGFAAKEDREISVIGAHLISPDLQLAGRTSSAQRLPCISSLKPAAAS